MSQLKIDSSPVASSSMPTVSSQSTGLSAPSSSLPLPGRSFLLISQVKLNTLALVKNLKFESLVAGITGGVLSTLVLHPLDLLKIRFAG